MWAIAIPILVFIFGLLVKRKEIIASGWVLFGLYWASRLPYYALEVRSVVETALVLLGIPVFLYAAKLSYEEKPAMNTLTQLTATAGAITLAASIPVVEQFLIEIVANNTVFVLDSLGYESHIVEGKNFYQSEIVLAGTPYSTYITLGCTGIGAISVFAGLFTAVDGNIKNRVIGFLTTASIIYLLNIGRNVFVSLSYGMQWFDAPWIARTVGYSSDAMASFYVSHTVISQPSAVIALLGVIWISINIEPNTKELVYEIVDLLVDVKNRAKLNF